MKQRLFCLILAAALLLTWGIGASTASAAEYYLRAEIFYMTMPDATVVPMWGYSLGAGPSGPWDPATSPGPRLTVPPGDTTLTIHLTNQLPAWASTSLVIPGLTATMTPVRLPNGRARAITAEVASGGSGDYTWTGLRPGTFMYHSGSQMQVQVQMGLFGMVTQDYATGEAYPGIPYDVEAPVVFSEVDPELHNAVVYGQYGDGLAMTSTIDYAPKYFLINGAAGVSYTQVAAAQGERVLLRFVNAGLKTKAPYILDRYMWILAEDGFAKGHPQQKYSVELTALKTIDAAYLNSGGVTAGQLSVDLNNTDQINDQDQPLEPVKIADRSGYVTQGIEPTAVAPSDGGGGSSGSASSGGGGGCFISTLE